MVTQYATGIWSTYRAAKVGESRSGVEWRRVASVEPTEWYPRANMTAHKANPSLPLKIKNRKIQDYNTFSQCVIIFMRCVALKKAFSMRNRRENLFLCLLLVFLGEQDCLDVWQNTASSDGDSREELVQFFVITDSKLKMSWDDSCFLVVTGSVTG